MSALRDCTFQSAQSTQESLAQASVTSQQPPVHCPAADKIFPSFLAHDGTRPGEKFELCLAHRKSQQTNFSISETPKEALKAKPKSTEKPGAPPASPAATLLRPCCGPTTVLRWLRWLRWLCLRAGTRQLRRTVCPRVLFQGPAVCCISRPPRALSLLMLLVSGTLSYLRDR